MRTAGALGDAFLLLAKPGACSPTQDSLTLFCFLIVKGVK